MVLLRPAPKGGGAFAPPDWMHSRLWKSFRAGLLFKKANRGADSRKRALGVKSAALPKNAEIGRANRRRGAMLHCEFESCL